MWYINWLKLAKKIGIIVGLVLLYFLIDFSGFMPSFLSINKASKTKIEITNSPAVLEEVKQMGELISAEYYGEVYADLLEVYSDTIQKYGEEIANYPGSLYAQFPGFSSYFVSKNKEDFKRNLVYIARGSVKMGFDFSAIENKNFEVNNFNDSVVISLPSAKMLDVDINPWYVADKIEGFEVFKEEKAGIRFSNTEVLSLKQKCKQKLAKEALEMKLDSIAEQNGKKVLEEIFQLFTDKKIIVQFK